MCTLADIIPKQTMLYKNEKKRLRSIDGHKNVVQIHDFENMGLLVILQSILKQKNEKFAHCAIDKNLRFNVEKMSIFFMIQGKGMRYCVIQEREHSSNRVFFELFLRKKKMTLGCFKEECKHIKNSALKGILSDVSKEFQ